MKVLVLGRIWPEPKSSAAGKRILQIMDVFDLMGMDIHFASSAHKTEYSTQWSYGVTEHSIEVNSSSFDDWIKELQPDIVLFDQINCEEYYSWRINKHCPDAIRILDCEDLQMLRKGRESTVRSKKEFKIESLPNDNLAYREIACILRCHLSIIISEFEKELLESDFNISSTSLAYFPLLAKELKETPSYEERQSFLSIGNFIHAPNLDSVKYLKKEIWPLIREQLPEVEIELYGAYPNEKVMNLNDSTNGFHIRGRADDAFEVIQKAKVMLAPLRFGAGQKGKLLDAMICQTPSVTTSIGAESMNGKLEWNGFIEDVPTLFAQKAVELYKNQDIWKQAQSNGKHILQSRFNSKRHKEDLIKQLNDLMVKSIVKDSFEMRMLNHHSFKNAEYMSRWIEEKRKLQ